MLSESQLTIEDYKTLQSALTCYIMRLEDVGDYYCTEERKYHKVLMNKLNTLKFNTIEE